MSLSKRLLEEVQEEEQRKMTEEERERVSIREAYLEALNYGFELLERGEYEGES